MSLFRMMFDVPLIVAMGAPQEGTNPVYSLGVFVVIIGIFYFLLLLPARRKQQKVQAFLDNLKVGDRVITTGGIYGQVTKLGGDSIQLQIADKLRIEVAKASIGGYQGQAPVNEPAEQAT